jgi:hypothetical protein
MASIATYVGVKPLVNGMQGPSKGPQTHQLLQIMALDVMMET